MLYSALKYEVSFNRGRSLNIGDLIQTLAAIQFLPHIDFYLERHQQDSLLIPGETAFCIMNGWYSTKMLPPPKQIKPFYISVHFSTPEILTPAVVEHLKDQGPIGCRDYATYSMLQKAGIAAYYSGCLTLSFPRCLTPREALIYLVDVHDMSLADIPDRLRDQAQTIYYGTSRKLVDILLKDRGKIARPLVTRKLAQLVEIGRELAESIKFFRDREFTRLYPRIWTPNDSLHLLHLFKAQSLLNLYRKASLVVTSRLHAAAPCLALGTPVVFLPRPVPQQWASFGEERFQVIEPYLPLNCDKAQQEINWHPQSVDLKNHQKFLTLLCRKAVEMGDNPLKELSLESFMQASNWYGAIPNDIQ